MTNNKQDYKLTKLVEYGFTTYFATFEDGEGHEQIIEIDRHTFLTIKKSQTHGDSYQRALRRYGVCSFDETIGTYATNGMDDKTREFYDELDRLLGTLTEVQRRRFDMRVFQGMKMEQIAEKEGTNLYAITKSLDQAKEKLKNLKNFF